MQTREGSFAIENQAPCSRSHRVSPRVVSQHNGAQTLKMCRAPGIEGAGTRNPPDLNDDVTVWELAGSTAVW